MRLFIILFSVFISSQVIAQPSHLKGLDYDQIAMYYIKYLKNGSLYVRLHTKSRKIAILKRAGNLATAEKVKKDQFKVNLSIVKAFKEAFTFCPVYFFYSDDSKYLLSGNIDSVRFLDDSLQYWPNLKPSAQFLVAEFGIIQEDTAQNLSGSSRDYHKDSTGSLYRNKQYSGGTNMSFGALIIKSEQLVQLPRPFPYYARTLSTLPMLRRSHSRVVTIMNENLISYYARLE